MLRASVRHARALRSARERSAAERDLAAHGVAAAAGCETVAGHVAVGTEPPTRALLEALVAAGVRVLVPRVDGATLVWGDLTTWESLQPNDWGLLQPHRTTAEAASAAAAADLILVPALAVDRAGNRLGRGAGFFDRWLPTSPRGRVLAVVYDDEVLPAVPHEPHDRLVDGALTPGGVVLRQ